jgi:hypothetical protein
VFGRTTRFQAILILAFLIANVLFITLEAHNGPAVMSRSGLMSCINLALLLFGHHMSIAFRNRGPTSEDYGKIHRWLGRVAVIEGIIHSAIAFASSTSNPDIMSQISTWTVGFNPFPIPHLTLTLLCRHF